MKGKIILLCFICSITHISCKAKTSFQIASADSVVVSTCPVYIYPLTGDKNIEKIKHCGFIYPLLILNGVIIREETKINWFRNHFDRTKTKIKLVSAEKARKKGILNVPKDGVLFVTMKKGYYFDFSCE
jgi:hypothetical protein